MSASASNEPMSEVRKLTRAADTADYQDIRRILAMPESDQEAAFSRFTSLEPPDSFQRESLRVAFMRGKGDILKKSGRLKAAIAMYKSALRVVVKPKFEFLLSAAVNEGYVDAIISHDNESTLPLDLIACCYSLAEAYLKLGDQAEALNWLHEITTVYFCYKLTFTLVSSGDLRSRVVEYYSYRIKAGLLLSLIYRSLENIAAASFFAYTASKVHTMNVPDNIPEIEELKRQIDMYDFFTLRSPDLKLINDCDVSDPRLQMRGIWSKIDAKAFLGPKRREASASWIWRSRLYVFGGIVIRDKKSKYSGRLRDIWYLDLKFASHGQWDRLPDIPPFWGKALDVVTKPIVYNDLVWFFMGSRNIVRFNLLQNTWDIVSTSIKNTKWPYKEDKTLSDPCVELYKDSLVVFGGDQSSTSDGLDILMILNMRTLEWRHIKSPDPANRTIINWPHPRRAAASWIVPREERLYVMYGSSNWVDESGSLVSLLARHLDDFWSYSIPEEKWRRESPRGSFPSCRDLMAAVYSEALGVAVCYGGYNQLVQGKEVVDGAYVESKVNSYTYYGDTFIMDPLSHSWRQVVTRTFPAWRNAACFLVDKDTSKIYVYGGACNRYYLGEEEKANSNRTFSRVIPFDDLWELRIDVAGCQVDAEAFYSLSALKVGVWRRCYTCKKMGKDLMKCRGSCNGKFVFCSSNCHRAAWPMHKQVHGCRKV